MNEIDNGGGAIVTTKAKKLEQILPLRRLILAAASLGDIFSLLKKIKDPGSEVTKCKELLEKIVAKYDGKEQGYGHVADVGSMTKLLEILSGIKVKKPEVAKAIEMLEKLLGKGIKPSIGELANLPSYGESKLEASDKPGVYRARLIRAGEALDGKNWPAEQLQSAVEKGLFNGIPLNAITYSGKYGDLEYHLPEDSPFVGSTVGNQVGFVKDVTWDSDESAAYGLCYVTDGSRRKLIDSMLEEGIDAPGLSIYAAGDLDDDNKVGDIDLVYSMDLVTFPAAGGAILSQALTAAVREWGDIKRRLQAADEVPVTDDVTPAVEPTVPEQPTTSALSDWQWPILGEMPSDSSFGAMIALLIAGGKELTRETVDALKRIWDDMLRLEWETVHKEHIENPHAAFLTKFEAHSEVQNLLGTQVGEQQLPEALAKQPVDQAVPETVTAGMLGGVGRFCNDEQIKEILGGAVMNKQEVDRGAEQVRHEFEEMQEQVGGFKTLLAVTETQRITEKALTASGLPEKVKVHVRQQLEGKILGASEIDSFVSFQKNIIDDVASTLAEKAAVTIEGDVVDFEDKSLESACDDMFLSEAAKRQRADGE